MVPFRSPRNPVRGRPKPLELCSVFLLMPASDLLIDGISFRAGFKSIGSESLFRSLEKVRRQGEGRPALRLVARLVHLLGARQSVPLLGVIRGALSGDEAAKRAADELGFWECLNAGFSNSVHPLRSASAIHYVSVEARCKGAFLSLLRADFRGAAEQLAADQVASMYMSPAALRHLASATSQNEALPARVAGMCDFLIANAALAEGALRHRDAVVQHGGDFAALLSGDQGEPCRPGRALVHALMREFNVRSLNALLSLDLSETLDDSTLKRWSSGREFPSELFLGFAASLFSQHLEETAAELALDVLSHRYWAARRLQRVLDIGRRLHWSGSSTRLPSGWTALLQEEAAPDDWCRLRFSHWQLHWSSSRA